jgi:diaminohydroxyphosphoribosylaminopyrimidine deaminase / 5-amino-6-(5-phosphoribosylamino)uracil reductase
MLIGGDGIPAVAGFGLGHLDKAPRFERMAVEAIGDDVLEMLRRRA